MTYSEIVRRLFSFPGRGVKTFEAMQRLDERLGHPHRHFRSVHVGGTNGKGSVAEKVAKSLQEEGYRVGLYTSPHISDFRERIRIDGEMIPEQEAHRFLNLLFPLVQEELSFFDLLTAMAFLHFKEQKVDWAVIEVGLGGRLDATNVVFPEVAAIASIGYDHMHILGNSLEEIAKEKGGIAKRGIPLIAGPSAAPFFPEAIAVGEEKFYDVENQGVARAVLENLKVSGSSIAKGLSVRPRGRFEIRGNLILDVAHNPDGFKRLIEALEVHFPGQRFHFAVAFSKGKEWRACLDLIRPAACRITAIRGKHEKLLRPEEINGIEIADPAQISRTERVVVCGSFYIMDEVLKEIGPILYGEKECLLKKPMEFGRGRLKKPQSYFAPT